MNKLPGSKIKNIIPIQKSIFLNTFECGDNAIYLLGKVIRDDEDFWQFASILKFLNFNSYFIVGIALKHSSKVGKSMVTFPGTSFGSFM